MVGRRNLQGSFPSSINALDWPCMTEHKGKTMLIIGFDPSEPVGGDRGLVNWSLRATLHALAENT